MAPPAIDSSSPAATDAPLPGDHLLAVDAKNVVMRFGGALALRGVEVRSEAQKIHALIGANGAGKSTFLGIIAGRVAPTEGQVSIFGRPTVSARRVSRTSWGWRRSIRN